MLCSTCQADGRPLPIDGVLSAGSPQTPVFNAAGSLDQLGVGLTLRVPGKPGLSHRWRQTWNSGPGNADVLIKNRTWQLLSKLSERNIWKELFFCAQSNSDSKGMRRSGVSAGNMLKPSRFASLLADTSGFVVQAFISPSATDAMENVKGGLRVTDGRLKRSYSQSSGRQFLPFMKNRNLRFEKRDKYKAKQKIPIPCRESISSAHSNFGDISKATTEARTLCVDSDGIFRTSREYVNFEFYTELNFITPPPKKR